MGRKKKTTILTEFWKNSLNQWTAWWPNRVVEKHILGISPWRMRNIAKEVVENSTSSWLNCNTVMQCPWIVGLSTAISTLQLQIITALSYQPTFVDIAPIVAWTWWPKILNTGTWAGTIYYSDWTNIFTNLNLWWWSWSWIIYSLSNGTVVVSTTGNRWLASTLTGADKTYETSQEIDPLTWDTVNMNFWQWGTVNYDWSTVNSTNTTYNHDWDTINNNDVTINNTGTTTVNGGTYNNTTLNNATFTGSSVIAGALVTDYIAGNSASTVYTLSHIPSGTIQVAIQWWVIQVDPSDFSHTDDTITFTGNVDFSWLNLIVTYIKWVAVTAPSLKVWPITRTPAWSSFTHTNALSTTTSVVNGVSVVSGTVNGNYFDFDTSVAWQITFTSKDFLGNSVSENGIVFYYTINY